MKDACGCQFYIACLYCFPQGGDQIDLIPNGAETEVNASNVHDYVRKYAEYRMVKQVEKPLEVSLLYHYVIIATVFTLILMSKIILCERKDVFLM